MFISIDACNTTIRINVLYQKVLKFKNKFEKIHFITKALKSQILA